MSEQRTRPDGTRTFTTPEWDADWYWPVGTRVAVCLHPASHPSERRKGVVIKQNSVSVRVRLDDGHELLVPKRHPALSRVESTDEPDDAACPECERSNGPHYRGRCPH